MSTQTRSAAISVDRARQVLQRHIEQWCEQGVSNVKVRINLLEGAPASVWFLGRTESRWQKHPEMLEGSQFATLIADEMQRLATSPHSEECQIRRKKFLDRVEFEIKFHHDKIVAHQGAQLGSYLSGVLFRERHAPKDPKRQGVRRALKRVLVKR